MDITNAPSIEGLVQQAYRWILGRDGDPGGVELYANALRSGGLTEADLRNLLVSSDEFRIGTRDRRLDVDVGGFAVVVDPSDPELGAYIAHHGGWEPNIRAVIRRFLPAGGVFVDVGANVGVMSFEAAQIASKVIAFEPHPMNADNFRRGIALNSFNNVLLYQLGLSDAQRMIRTTLDCNAKVADGAPNVVQAVTGDSILLNEDRIDMIKIDIEGYEPYALAGLSTTIARHHPTMVVEFNPACLPDPGAFADQICDVGVNAVVTEGGEDLGTIDNAASLMLLWESRASIKGATVHFDLIVTT